MICRSCNRNLPARARYCVHCGAEQDLPTPIAFAAALAGVRREAANAVYAESAPSGRRDPRTVEMAVRAPSEEREEEAANRPQAPAEAPRELDSTPAYANAPSRYRLAAALVVACVVLGVVALAGAWWLRPSSLVTASGNAATSTAPAVPSPQASAVAPAAEAPSPDASTGSSETAPPAADASATPTAEAPASADASTQTTPSPEPPAEAPVQITPLPPHRGATRPHAAPRAPAAKPEASAAEPAPAPAAPAASTSPKHAAAASPPAAAKAPVDRWARMDEELSRCTREDFIARVVCGQRVRFRYCDGYWGKVPACPGNPSPERGQ